MNPPELIIAAGEAFGSGAHPSTALSLQALQGIAQGRPDITSVLDIGCGSGILSIAAAQMLPKASIIASDIHEDAPDFTMHNASVNEVAKQITAIRADGVKHALIDDNAPYDLLLCNHSPQAIATWLADFHRLTRANSLIIISGILQQFETGMHEAAHHVGLGIITTLAQEDWRAMISHHAHQ